MMTTIFEAIVKSDGRGRGAAGETFAAELLKSSGYDVVKRDEPKCGDLRAADINTGEFWNIEVKTAKRRPDGRFCFHLYENGKTDYRYSDYVLLIAVLSAGKVASFLIPVKVLKRRGAKTITLPKNLNSSRWSHYRVKRTVNL
jgi:hypothetical protein